MACASGMSGRMTSARSKDFRWLRPTSVSGQQKSLTPSGEFRSRPPSCSGRQAKSGSCTCRQDFPLHRGQLAETASLRLASGPVLHFQTTHAPELPFVVCNQCQPGCDGMSGDPKIVVANHLALRFQFGANPSVDFTRCFRQGECRQLSPPRPAPLA